MSTVKAPTKSKTAAKPRVRKPAAEKAVKTPTAPTREEVAKLAEQFWHERGRHGGSAEHDWLRAEQELRGKAS